LKIIGALACTVVVVAVTAHTYCWVPLVSSKPCLGLPDLFYCTTKLKLVVAVNPALVAVTVTANVPAGVPGTGGGAGGATPQPAIASKRTSPSMSSIGKRFTPFLRCPPKAASTMPNTGKANMA
jgi:hypothetical protein